MRKSNHERIRKILKTCDGMTVAGLVDLIMGISDASVREALKNMPDTYIDRWTPGRKGWTAVWCVVDVPEDCPKPKKEKP